jgi:glutathione S-transferase
MRVRWALEEVGQPYDVHLASFTELKLPEHRTLNPFGQIPTFENGTLRLFESGAIVFHVASTCPGLLPVDAVARARAVMWMFAALNTVEPPILEREQAGHSEGDKDWYTERLALLDNRIRARLDDLAQWLGEAEWLEGEFTAGDLMMVLVLRRAEGMGILDDYPTLTSYVARAEARPAYKRAFQDQLAVFTDRR